MTKAFWRRSRGIALCTVSALTQSRCTNTLGFQIARIKSNQCLKRQNEQFKASRIVLFFRPVFQLLNDSNFLSLLLLLLSLAIAHHWTILSTSMGQTFQQTALLGLKKVIPLIWQAWQVSMKNFHVWVVALLCRAIVWVHRITCPLHPLLPAILLLFRERLNQADVYIAGVGCNCTQQQ